MFVAYQDKTFQPATERVIAQARAILAEYAQQGLAVTLRQLYYQFVARDLLPNRQREYNRLGRIVSDARMAGLLNWSAIEDRTREVVTPPTWEDPAAFLQPDAFQLDLWEGQDFRPEVWVEKEALAGVIERTARRLRVPSFACRGYTSQSSTWEAGRRILRRWFEQGQRTVVLHLGDHDPSGIDMTRDIRERLDLFTSPVNGHDPMDARVPGDVVTVRRLALNMDQVEQYDPPPNPAKLTDSRVGEYQLCFGDSSWELDALDPSTLDRLITDAVDDLRDEDLYQAQREREAHHRQVLAAACDRWAEVEDLLTD